MIDRSSLKRSLCVNNKISAATHMCGDGLLNLVGKASRPLGLPVF